jgi:hypothetical protein
MLRFTAPVLDWFARRYAYLDSAFAHLSLTGGNESTAFPTPPHCSPTIISWYNQRPLRRISWFISAKKYTNTPKPTLLSTYIPMTYWRTILDITLESFKYKSASNWYELVWLTIWYHWWLMTGLPSITLSKLPTQCKYLNILTTKEYQCRVFT